MNVNNFRMENFCHRKTVFQEFNLIFRPNLSDIRKYELKCSFELNSGTTNHSGKILIILVLSLFGIFLER